MPKRSYSGAVSKPKRQTRWDRKTRLVKYRRAPRDPFPQSVVVTLPYCATFQLDSSTGFAATKDICANGIYDPDVSGVGHQPYGRDIYEQIYENYKVLSSVITCEFISGGNGSTGGFRRDHIGGITLTNNNAPLDSFDELREQTGSKYTICTASGSGYGKVTNYFNCNKMFPQSAASKDDLQAYMNANPTERALFKIWTTCVDNTENPYAVQVLLTIKYKVKMWQLKDLGPS